MALSRELDDPEWLVWPRDCDRGAAGALLADPLTNRILTRLALRPAAKAGR